MDSTWVNLMSTLGHHVASSSLSSYMLMTSDVEDCCLKFWDTHPGGAPRVSMHCLFDKQSSVKPGP